MADKVAARGYLNANDIVATRKRAPVYSCFELSLSFLLALPSFRIPNPRGTIPGQGYSTSSGKDARDR